MPLWYLHDTLTTISDLILNFIFWNYDEDIFRYFSTKFYPQTNRENHFYNFIMIFSMTKSLLGVYREKRLRQKWKRFHKIRMHISESLSKSICWKAYLVWWQIIIWFYIFRKKNPNLTMGGNAVLYLLFQPKFCLKYRLNCKRQNLNKYNIRKLSNEMKQAFLKIFQTLFDCEKHLPLIQLKLFMKLIFLHQFNGFALFHQITFSLTDDIWVYCSPANSYFGRCHWCSYQIWSFLAY